MTSSESDLRLPFDRPWREALAIYARSFKHFAVACLLGGLPIALFYVWVQAGPRYFAVAMALALMVAVLVLVTRQRAGRALERQRASDAAARLESCVKAAELRWAEPQDVSEVVFHWGNSLSPKQPLKPVKFYMDGIADWHGKIYIDAHLIPVERLDDCRVRLDALRPRLEEAKRDVLARRAEVGSLLGTDEAGATFVELASSRAHTWYYALDALHHFHAIMSNELPRPALESLGRSMKEVAVLETVQFARIMETTGHWWIWYVHGRLPAGGEEEENPFAIRE